MSKPEIKPEWRGLHDWRYEREPLEARLALAWQKFNELSAGVSGSHPTAVDDLLHVGESPTMPCSAESRTVVNTVIQWLGSPIGRGFVEDAMFSHELKVLLLGLRVVDPDKLPHELRHLRKNWLKRDLEAGL